MPECPIHDWTRERLYAEAAEIRADGGDVAELLSECLCDDVEDGE